MANAAFRQINLRTCSLVFLSLIACCTCFGCSVQQTTARGSTRRCSCMHLVLTGHNQN